MQNVKATGNLATAPSALAGSTLATHTTIGFNQLASTNETTLFSGATIISPNGATLQFTKDLLGRAKAEVTFPKSYDHGAFTSDLDSILDLNIAPKIYKQDKSDMDALLCFSGQDLMQYLGESPQTRQKQEELSGLQVTPGQHTVVFNAVEGNVNEQRQQLCRNLPNVLAAIFAELVASTVVSSDGMGVSLLPSVTGEKSWRQDGGRDVTDCNLYFNGGNSAVVVYRDPGKHSLCVDRGDSLQDLISPSNFAAGC